MAAGDTLALAVETGPDVKCSTNGASYGIVPPSATGTQLPGETIAHAELTLFELGGGVPGGGVAGACVAVGADVAPAFGEAVGAGDVWLLGPGVGVDVPSLGAGVELVPPVPVDDFAFWDDAGRTPPPPPPPPHAVSMAAATAMLDSAPKTPILTEESSKLEARPNNGRHENGGSGAFMRQRTMDNP